MPFAEWAKLERISAHIEDLHHRRFFAERIRNFDRALELAREIIMVEAQHHLLVDRITERLVQPRVTPGLGDPRLGDPRLGDPSPPDHREAGAGNCAC
jgi:hypothetical protein